MCPCLLIRLYKNEMIEGAIKLHGHLVQTYQVLYSGALSGGIAVEYKPICHSHSIPQI